MEACPESSSGAAAITAVERGETSAAIPSPITVRSGRIKAQNWPKGRVAAMPTKAIPTTVAPAVIGQRAPMRFLRFKTTGRETGNAPVSLP